MSYEFIRCEETNDNEVIEVIIGPPPANIVTAKVMEEISSLLKEEGQNKNRKLIIFSGEGKHFSFGASVEEHKPEHVDNMLPGFHRMIGDLINCSIPTLAKVSGMCLGGGFELAIACTFLFADEKAKFGVPEIQLAVFPPVASVLLPFKCSDTFASQVILSGNQFTARELQAHGLINSMSPTEALDDTVTNFFQGNLKAKSASSLRLAKKAGTMVMSRLYGDYITDLEKLYLKDLMSTHDAKEGITAFLEKRKPAWKNE